MIYARISEPVFLWTSELMIFDTQGHKVCTRPNRQNIRERRHRRLNGAKLGLGGARCERQGGPVLAMSRDPSGTLSTRKRRRRRSTHRLPTRRRSAPARCLQN